MGKPIINGREWIDQRIAFLRWRLKEAVSDEERERIEAEIGMLEEEDPLRCDPRPAWTPSWRLRRRREQES